MRSELSIVHVTVEEELRAAIARLEERVAALEGGRPARPRDASRVAGKAAALPPQSIGVALIILGGAYLLRAIAQATALSELAVAALALGYAIFWIWLGHRAKSIWYSGTGVFIAFALAWESCTRFHLVEAPVAAAIIALVAIGTLILATRDDLRLLAWLVAAGASVALIALAIGTRAIAPAALAIVPVCIAAVGAATRREWMYLAFAPGVTLDLMLIVLAGTAAIGKPEDARIAAAAIALFAMAATFSVFAWKRETLMTFDTAQLIAVIVIALTGTTALLLPFWGARLFAGVLVLALAIAAYALRHATFTFAAVILALFGSALAMELRAATIVWALLAIVLALLRARAQAAAFASASFALSGLLVFSIGALAAPSVPSPEVVAVLAFIAIAAATALTRPAHLLLITLTALGAAAMIVALIGPSGRPQTATLRTILLAVLALLAGRFARTRVLVNPILIAGAVKLLAEDFRVGSPATLFVSLAVYGGALVLASRGSATSGTSESAPPAPSPDQLSASR